MFDLSLSRILLSIPAILIALTLHELSHGYVAYRLGDNTAKSQGRLSLNPLKHLDPIGALFLLVVGFGWAKPVPVNPMAFKNREKGMAIVAIAGPASNLIMALLGGIVLLILNQSLMGMTTSPSYYKAIEYFAYFLMYFIQINIVLMVFNLIPVPPLDGSRVLATFLSKELRYRYYQVEQFGMLIMMAMCFPIFGGRSVISMIISTPVSAISTWIYSMAGLA